MTSKDRLFEYIKYKGLPISKFERLSGVSNGYLKSSRASPGCECQLKTTEIYAKLLDESKRKAVSLLDDIM